MAFPKPPPRVPAAIEQIVVTLRDVPAAEGLPARQTITYRIEILDAGGRRIDFDANSGDLEPFLTAPQVGSLKTFLSNLRAKAEQELL